MKPSDISSIAANNYWNAQHVPQKRQWRTRKGTPRVVMLHTTQNRPDYHDQDFNAENCAKWILKRNSYGSYHYITDRDSFVPFVNPKIYAAFGCRTVDGIAYNDLCIHQSMATKAEEYRDDESWAPSSNNSDDWLTNGKAQYALNGAVVTAAVCNMFSIPATLVTPQEIKAGKSGITTHAMADPTRRFDPGFSPHELGVYIGLVEELMNPMQTQTVAACILDPLGTPVTPGRVPFWAIFDNGFVSAHNGARYVPSDLPNLKLNAPVTAAQLDETRNALILMAPGDGGTFKLLVSNSPSAI